MTTKVLRCVDNIKKNESTNQVKQNIKPTSIQMKTISSISLALRFSGILVTSAVYLIIPDFKNLHGKIVLSNILAIAFFTFYMIFVLNIQENSLLTCAVVGHFGYFASLSMFFWMTIMCIDLCWTFSKTELLNRRTEKIKFSLYSIVGWGIPVALTGTLCVSQYYLLSPSSQINPRIGQEKCYFTENNISEIIWMFVPLSITMVINVGAFMFMIMKLVIAKWETRTVRLTAENNQRNQNNSSDLKQQLVNKHSSQLFNTSLLMFAVSVPETILSSWNTMDM